MAGEGAEPVVRTAQRRQVTVLFTDMVSFTPTAERLGEEQTFALMRSLLGLMQDVVEAHGGSVQNVTGDGLMALFGAPSAAEDAPLNACRAAIEIQARLARERDELEAAHGARPELRIGIHTGAVVVGEVMDGSGAGITALGDTVNLAARLESLAEPGSALLSEATHTLVEQYVEAECAGSREVKGKTEPQTVYRLKGVREGVSRFDAASRLGLTDFVGRERELEVLQRSLRQARNGRKTLVNIVGEAGVGKTRLVYEFRQQLHPDEAFFVRGRCTPEGQATPFFPFIDVLRSWARLAPDEDLAVAERRLELGLRTVGIEPSESLPYLLHLLGRDPEGTEAAGLDSEVLGARIRDSLLSLLRERCRLGLTILFIDDLHWIDRASEELIRRVAEQGGDDELAQRLLVVCLCPTTTRTSNRVRCADSTQPAPEPSVVATTRSTGIDLLLGSTGPGDRKRNALPSCG